MDYEKAYKEALERIKGYVKDEYGCTRLRPENIFPELAESKGERIRKEMIDFFKGFYDNQNVKAVDVEPWLDWLQDELKIVEWSEEDEKFFKTALWHISNSISNGKNTDIHCDTTDWLKSLRDRLHSLGIHEKE